MSKDTELTLAEQKALKYELGEFMSNLPLGSDRWTTPESMIIDEAKPFSSLIRHMADCAIPLTEFHSLGGKKLTVNEQIALQLLVLAGRGNLGAIQEYSRQIQQNGELNINVNSKVELDAVQIGILAEMGIELDEIQRMDPNVVVIDAEVESDPSDHTSPDRTPEHRTIEHSTGHEAASGVASDNHLQQAVAPLQRAIDAQSPGNSAASNAQSHDDDSFLL